MQLYRWSQKGILERPSFRLFATPYTSYAIELVIIVPTLVGGW